MSENKLKYQNLQLSPRAVDSLGVFEAKFGKLPSCNFNLKLVDKIPDSSQPVTTTNICGECNLVSFYLYVCGYPDFTSILLGNSSGNTDCTAPCNIMYISMVCFSAFNQTPRSKKPRAG